MRSVKLTTAKFLLLFFVAFGLQLGATAQENSPYSRYGVGDLTPNHNISSRGMGGIAAGVNNNRFIAGHPYYSDVQSLNFTNPASLANVYKTIFDVAAEADFRTIKSSSPAKKFTSANSYFSYLQMAFPLTTPKMAKKDMTWGLSFGLRPVSKINYKIEKNERLTNIDSLNTLYEGSGGINQAYFGTALRIKNFSFGIIAGYMFGRKDYSTRLNFINDTVIYAKSNTANETSFGGLFINGGIQYDFILNKENTKEVAKILRVGVYGNLQQKLNANSSDIREIISYDANGDSYRIDSVYQKDTKGNIKLPAMVGAGFTYNDANWVFGADFEFTSWNGYRYFGQADQVQNSWNIRAGGQYYPFKGGTTKKYFNFVKYRAGFYYGSDYIKINANRPEYGFSLGTGMPLTTLKRINYNGDVTLNTALEIGSRGNKQTNLRENVVRFSIGISMNANWFQKPKYN